MRRKKNITAFILAGGKSLRMGSDKGLLPFGKKLMVESIIHTFQNCFEEINIVGGSSEYEHFGVPIIPDLIPDHGPAGGIYSALHHSKNELNFFLACDMPLVTKEFIHYVLKHSKADMITVPFVRDRWEPLIGTYPKVIQDRWREKLLEGVMKMSDLVEHFKGRPLAIESDCESLLFNVNTKSQYEQLLEKEKG